MNKKTLAISYIFYCLFSICFLSGILIKFADWIGINLSDCSVGVWVLVQISTTLLGIILLTDQLESKDND